MSEVSGTITPVEVPEAVTSPPVPVPTRDSIRSAIFASKNKRGKTKEIEFFGQLIELRQPKLDDVIGAGIDQLDAEGKPTAAMMKKSSVEMLCNYAYVPGTDDHVFEQSDYDAIMSLPFGADFQRLQSAITELTTLNFPLPTGS